MRRKSSIMYPNVDEYIAFQINEDNQTESLMTRWLSIKNVISFCITVTSIYNIIFIPLSFAFRIPFEGVYLSFEVATVFFYLVDICLRWSKLNSYYQMEKIPDSRLSPVERKLKNDPEQLHRNKRIQKVEIGVSIAACLPIVSLLSFLEVYNPWPFICLLCSVRLLKFGPII